MKRQGRQGRHRVVVLLLILVAAVVLLFVPYTPSNAVRLTLVQHAQPVKGLLVYPIKLADSEGEKYSGRLDWTYYHVQFTVGTSKFSTRVIGVHQVAGSIFYRGTPVRAK